MSEQASTSPLPDALLATAGALRDAHQLLELPPITDVRMCVDRDDQPVVFVRGDHVRVHQWARMLTHPRVRVNGAECEFTGECGGLRWVIHTARFRPPAPAPAWLPPTPRVAPESRTAA